MGLKRYENIGTSPIRINKSLVLNPGEETTEFLAVEPALENFWFQIGAMKVVEEKKKSKDISPVALADPSSTVTDAGGLPVVSADVDPATVPQALTESEIKTLEKANKKIKK